MLTKKDPIKSDFKTNKTAKTAAELHSSPFSTTPDHNPLSTLSKQCSSKSNEAACSQPTSDAKKAPQKTRVTIKFNVGYSNQLYIRGKGANLSWEKGIPLRNVKADEWTWESDANCSHCEFKILINDKQYETGDNHYLTNGSSVVYTPHF